MIFYLVATSGVKFANCQPSQPPSYASSISPIRGTEQTSDILQIEEEPTLLPIPGLSKDLLQHFVLDIYDPAA